MKANELRIGNYITDIWAHKDSYFQVRQIGEKHLWYGLNSTDSFKALNDNIRPIPITEEWLVKFRFEYSGIRKFYTLDLFDGFYFTAIPNMKAIAISKKGQRDIHINCEFVHQLQNIFWILTWEELKLKE